MNQSFDFASGLGQFISMLRDNPRRWSIPTVLLGSLAVVYALVRPDTWEASQALVVRNEATADRDAPGRFNDSGEMKTAQETIQELVQSRSVLEAALLDIGQPSESRTEPEAWPSARDVARLRKNVDLSPPRGAEFGSTEVFYLTVEDENRSRAVRLVDAICENLEHRYQELRDRKARSMIDELVKASDLARQDLIESNARLTNIEEWAGEDLADLRALLDANSGESTLRQTIIEIRSELRQARSDEEANRQLLSLLKDARLDSIQLVATPSRLLESQPALSRLKDGLIDARLQTASLAGKMAAGHPLVTAAKESETAIARHLRNELDTAVRGIEVELRLNRDRAEMLEEQLADVTGRLAGLASIRADYSTQVAETQNRTELLERAERRLSEARISQAGAAAASLISPIDTAQAGINPAGPGRASIALVGIVGGLLTGIGIVVLSAQPIQPATARSGAAAIPSPSRDSASIEHDLSLTETLDKLVEHRGLWG